MLTRLPAKIPDELQSADYRNWRANHLSSHVIQIQFRDHTAECSRAQYYNGEVEDPIDTLKAPAPCRMVEGIAQDVKSNDLGVLKHYQSFFGGGDAGAGAATGAPLPIFCWKNFSMR